MNIKIYDHKGKGDFHPDTHYEWRLEWLKNQIQKYRNQGREITDEQVKKWEREEKCFYDNNVKTFKIIERMQKDTCIIICSHSASSHQPWLHSCISQLRSLNLYTILAYDNPFYDERHNVADRMPAAKTFMLIDELIMKAKSWGGGVGVPHSFNMLLALRHAKSLDFKHCLCINGDCVVTKPEGFDWLFKEYKNWDAITCDYEEGRYFGTMMFLMTIEYALAMWNKNFQYLWTPNFGTAESRMGRFSKELNLRVYPVVGPEKSHHFYFTDDMATFRQKLGLHHYHPEWKWCRKEHKDPSYMFKWADWERVPGNERKILDQFIKTGDKKILEKWYI